jgi:hypothetical protein
VLTREEEKSQGKAEEYVLGFPFTLTMIFVFDESKRLKQGKVYAGRLNPDHVQEQ